MDCSKCFEVKVFISSSGYHHKYYIQITRSKYGLQMEYRAVLLRFSCHFLNRKPQN